MIYRQRHHLPYANRRSTERIALPPSDSLVVELDWEGRTIPANLVDLSARGIGVRTAQEASEQIPVGALVRLVIAHPIDGWQVETTAEVRNVGLTGPEHQHVGLQFINEGQLFQQLTSALGRYFNRRGESRAAAQADEPTWVSVRSGECTFEGTLYDLSTSGVGVHFTASGSAWTPATDATVQVSIDFESAPGWSVEARVARTREHEGRTFVGFAFGDLSPEQHDAICAWMDEHSDALETFERTFAA
ncbi:MAG: PilZ domain-containing protein [Planctomycetota bacterium]|nr:PilZ domain-containing protein [Planctomycetota bacterium]